MSGSLMCDICGENPQQIQLGNMETGEQKFICASCAARWGLDWAKQILPPEEIAAVIGPMFVTPAREDLLEGAAKVRKARKAKANPESGTDGSGTPPEIAEA